MSIKLNNVRFAYAETPDKYVLDIEHWSVAENEQVLIQGPSGIGKSTLLNILSGIQAVRHGEISIFGEHLNKMNNRQRDQFRADHIGYVFQQFNLIPYFGAIDNIQLASHFSTHNGRGLLRDQTEALLSTLNILPTEWHKPVSQLSIGQQQRVAIARALINQPKLLIADEPTSSLDEYNRDNFMSVLMPLITEKKITLIFVSHDMSLSRYFKRVDSLTDFNRLGEAL